jgi:hypothetical protein
VTLHPRRAAVAFVAVAALIPLGLAGCGDDSSDTAAPPPTGAPDATIATEEFPPNDFEELAAVFDPMLEPMGLVLTRGALIDRTDGGYERSDTGTHLALYVEPIDEASYTLDDYVIGVYDVTALVTPYVFERWTEIESYDICQEPPNAEDPSAEPFPVSQVEIDRASSDAFDWDGGDLEALLAASKEGGGVRVVTSRELREHPEFVLADDAARGAAGTTSTTE